MRVILKLYRGLERYSNNYKRNNGITLGLNASCIIKQLMKQNGIPTKVRAFYLVGEKTVSLNYKVQDGDVIKVFPYMAGG